MNQPIIFGMKGSNLLVDGLVIIVSQQAMGFMCESLFTICQQ
jgi:hypothetical protein